MKSTKHSGHPKTISITEFTSNQGAPKILIYGFAFIIFVGTLLLRLPIATQAEGAMTWMEALFLATSATTVTGLVLFSTVETLNLFGELVVLTLIQVGGIGFITLSVLLFRLIGRRVALQERKILQQILGVKASRGVVQLGLAVAAITFGIELLGAIILYLRWYKDLGFVQGAYYAIFHSISAYCNAGFDLFFGTDDPFVQSIRTDPIAIFTLAALIFIGTLGITTIFDFLNFRRTKHLSLHTRLIMPLIGVLIVAGILVLLLDAAYHPDAISLMPRFERWLTTFFTVISSRTAGITLVPIQDLGPASQAIIFVSMFIGGAPASMGGGVGLSTVAVVLVTLYNNVRGYPDVRVFERTLPTETVFKAVAIITVSTAVVMFITLTILLFDGGDLFAVGFEVVSAYSNTGYSLGITGELSQLSRILIIFTMFWGRLGPLTLVVALAQRDKHTQLIFPEERIIIG